MQSVKGRIVLVTGANRGIGKSIVEEFLLAGASKIYAAARNPESLKPLTDAYGERVVALRIDLNDPGSITIAARQAGDVEIVINNAGMLNIANPMASNAVAAMQDEMEVNVYGLMRMAQAFAPLLKVNGGGALVQLNSVASMKNFADFATYSASKAASYSITQGLRDVLKEQGTQVVSVLRWSVYTRARLRQIWLRMPGWVKSQSRRNSFPRRSSMPWSRMNFMHFRIPWPSRSVPSITILPAI
ncbi:MAG: SDR family oxidoreductase [Candidatus Thiodiazotropha endolucinida]